ncbi:MAG: hypothetical protein JRI23_16265 [Deltaproteobacteria bacterium]|nr:hypothetical protein [Deltaproteobacteria bacterium]MBW2533326.1 hypothetical protein [Deltaproteobacteria bacterium]
MFDDVAVHADTSDDGVTLRYELELRPTTAKVVLRGLRSLEQHVVEDAVQLREGRPFERRLLAWSLLGLLEAYHAAGYRAAALHPHVVLQNEQLSVCLEVEEGAKVTVATWSFSGVGAVAESELRSLMDTQEGRFNTAGGVYRPELWAQDALRVLAHYYDRGFVTIRIGEPVIEPSDDGTELSVTIPVEEGERYRVGSVSVSGAGLVPGKNYQSVLQIRSSEPFSRTRVMEDIERLREFHREVSGWAAAVEVTPLTKVDPDRLVVDIEYQVQ